MNNFYLTRQLHEQDNKERLIEQNQLLTAEHKLIIVLAEPGAGKTCLLDDLANQAGVQKHTAKAFAYSKHVNETDTLIIDGFDEWANNQNHDIYELLAKIQDCQPEKIILSSRSGEWLAQHTQACQEILGRDKTTYKKIIEQHTNNFKKILTLHSANYLSEDCIEILKKYISDSEEILKKNTSKEILDKHINICTKTLNQHDDIFSHMITYKKILEQHVDICRKMQIPEIQIFYLSAFVETEQAQIFQHLHAEHDFKQFLQATKRIELSPLLGNPLFFKLFANAYAEQNGQFTTKRAAFESAMNYLAKEENLNYSNTLPYKEKLALIENLFAKLLLSGSEGVALSDKAETKLFPRIETIVDNPDIRQILHTRFFQTADETERHRPIHRIVVEYCAAKNLLERINQKINPLRLSQCLSVIAPNGVVREDLRGLVGWLAALSESREIQEQLIELDPYAVIANGEPSLLLPTSKRKLLSKLQQLNDENSYFRGSDRWRSLSISGFFNEEIVEEVKQLLLKSEGDLQGLLLELLVDTPILSALAQPLQDIVRYTDDKRKDWYVRTLAGELLCEILDYPHKDEWRFLLKAGDTRSLKIAANIMTNFPNIFQPTDFEELLRECAKLYPADKYGFHLVIGERYFIHEFIESLTLPTVEFLLNKLSADLSCTCSKKIHDCDCLHGISNIISMLLDNFFEHTPEPYNPEQIWDWLKNLHFLRRSPSNKTLSMQILQENISLRKEILRLAFEQATEGEVIHQIRLQKFDWYGHIGLRLQPTDYWYLVDLAFEKDNVELWRYFRQIHVYDKENENKENPLRHHMRQQAMQKPNFLTAWYLTKERKQYKDNFQAKYERRQRRKNSKIKKRNMQYALENYQQIKHGQDLKFLKHFAYLLLQDLKLFKESFDNEELVKMSLFNSINFIEQYIPNLDELIDLKRKSEFSNIQTVLYAASLEILKRERNLNRLSKKALTALRVHLDVHYSDVSSEERTALQTECNRLLFSNQASIESFLRTYIEPQLVDSQCKHPCVGWLSYDEIFKPFQKTLSLEWLQRFDDMPEYAYTELFKQAALHGDLAQLKALIAQKCTALAKQHPYKTDNAELEQKREFWYLQAFYFLDSGYESYWYWLQQDSDLIFKIDNNVGSLKNNDYAVLSAEKIELVLNTFIDKWEKVDLPSGHSSSSPREEKAYRLLRDLVYKINDSRNGNPIPVLKRLLANEKYQDFYPILKSQLFHHVHQQKIKNIAVPTMKETVDLLENHQVISVESMRALILEELAAYQADLNGSEFTSKDSFYNGDKHVDENRATQIVGERLRLKLERYGIDCNLEYLMSDNKRCDFTCSKRIHDRQRLLVVEAKGQWHKELYSAIENQLVRQYTTHPNAEKQGIFLVYWFGMQEKLAGLKNTMSSASELQRDIKSRMPVELQGLIDVFVLDVSVDA